MRSPISIMKRLQRYTGLR